MRLSWSWPPWRRTTIVCQQWVEMVTDYLAGALPPALREAADRHLAACPHCREYLEQMRRTTAVSSRLRDADVPGDVLVAMSRAFVEFQRGGESS